MRCTSCGFENDRSAKRCGMCNEVLAKRGKGLLVLLASIFTIAAIVVVVYFTTDLLDGGSDRGTDTDEIVSDYETDEIVDDYDTDSSEDQIIDSEVPPTTSDLFAATGPGSDIHGAIHRIEYGDNVVYLFGTMHAAAPEWFPLSDVVEDAMRRADVFAFELDLTFGSIEMDELMEIVQFYEEAMFLPDKLTLADVLPEDVYEGIVEHIESFGRSYADIYQMNPIALGMELIAEVQAELFAEKGIYYDEQVGVDGYILDFAVRHEMPIIGLEPILQQLRIGFAPDEEILTLANFDGNLEDIMYDVFTAFTSREELLEELREEGTVIYADYLYNDLETLIQGMEVTDEDLENEFTRYMIEVLMNFRSTYYAERIAELLQDTDEPTTFFVAVGISHVIREGEHLTNIVEQLELRGITAEPIFE